jgi:dTDP-4-amino-4,6-dideoxygalactose transaminase
MTNKFIAPSNPLLQHFALQEEIEQAIIAVARSGEYILGPQVRALEKEAADYLGVKKTIACASGTDALLLSMVAMGIGAGDEIITSCFSFVSVVEAACYLGATPVLVDIHPQTFQLSPAEVKKAISKNTKAIIPVHLYGQSADMESFKEIASEHNLFVIEDSAQSFGAKYKEKQTGSMSDAGCFSFYPTKNLSCYGDGGLIALAQEDLVKDLLALRNHGSYQKYTYEKIGYNSRLDEIQAAVLRIKLKHIDRWNEQRKQIAGRYDQLLAEKVIIPFRDESCEHIFHQYTILTKRRAQIAQKLQEQNIIAGIYYPHPLHLQAALKNKCKATDCSNAEKIAQECLSLPIYPGLQEQEVEKIAKIVIQHS